MILTLQGEFEDEDMNLVFPGDGGSFVNDDDEDLIDGDGDEEEEEEEDDGDDDELTIEEVIQLEGLDSEEEDEEEEAGEEVSDEDDDDEESDEQEQEEEEEEDSAYDEEEEVDEEDGDEEDNSDFDSFLNASPSGKIDAKYSNQPDFNLFRGDPNLPPDISDIPPDAFVTDDDTKALRKVDSNDSYIAFFSHQNSLTNPNKTNLLMHVNTGAQESGQNYFVRQGYFYDCKFSLQEEKLPLGEIARAAVHCGQAHPRY